MLSQANRDAATNLKPERLFLPARSLSVCPSVTRRHCIKTKIPHDFFAVGDPEHSSFWNYLIHHEIGKGSPRARAIYKTGVGTNWRFFDL